MKYDFTTILERRGKDAWALDGIGQKHWGAEPDAPKPGFDPIPMWVADMNFATCPKVNEYLMKKAGDPTFGYFAPREEYFQAILHWQSERNGVRGLKKEHIGYENGVHGLVSSVIAAFTVPGDPIFLHRPYYVGFYGDIAGEGRKPVFSDLKKDQDGIWRMDYEEMDRVIKENHVHLAIFCSPHNPTGRVWEKEELEKAMEVFRNNQCLVISDEIWSDLVFPGHRHIPTQTVSQWAEDHVIAAYSPSKTFNLAGLIGSYHIIYNPYLRDRVNAYSASTHYNEMNIFSMYALMGAYTPEGSEWTDKLRDVLWNNCRTVIEYMHSHFPGVRAAMPQGTYMIFLDCTEYCKSSGKTIGQVIRAGWDVGVCWQDGRAFGGAHHIRMNVALPLSKVEEALERIRKYVFV